MSTTALLQSKNAKIEDFGEDPVQEEGKTEIQKEGPASDETATKAWIYCLELLEHAALDHASTIPGKTQSDTTILNHGYA